MEDNTEEDGLVWLNAKVIGVRVGSMAHDYRGFASVYFEFAGGQQGIDLRWDPKSIDLFLSVLGKEDLCNCLGAYVRIGKPSPMGLIHELRNIIDDDKSYSVRG